MSEHKSHAHYSQRKKDGLFTVAFWQLMSFLLLILVVWVNEVLDVTSLWFGTPESAPNLFRGFMLTICIIGVAIVAVGHTYMQQKRIISGLLTVCSSCRKIRVDENLWEQLDEYVSEHSLAAISHGICPTCFEQISKEIEGLEMPRKKQAAKG